MRVGSKYPVGTSTVQYLLYFYLFYKIFYRYYTAKQFASINLDLVYICLSLNLIVVKLSFKTKYVCLLAYLKHFFFFSFICLLTFKYTELNKVFGVYDKYLTDYGIIIT